MLEGVEWGEYRLGDLFEIHPTKAYKYTNNELFSFSGATPVVTNTSLNNGISGTVGLSPTEEGGIITYSDTTTSDAIFYQPHPFVGYSHVQGLYPKDDKWGQNTLLYVVASFRKSACGLFDYGNKFNRAIASEMNIILPTRDKEIDFEFMEKFIAELKALRIAELKAYLFVTGLKDYTLTPEEEQAVKDFEAGNVEWGKYHFEKVFNHIKQGRRLKKDDQKEGAIPFVMAGTSNTGVINYISNPIDTFPPNSITIDIFGNTFYRNYGFGAGDDTGVYWDDQKNYSKELMLFFTTAMSRALVGKYSFGKKLRSSQSLKEQMFLLEHQGSPDYSGMKTFISAIQKLVIKDVVLYADREIEATKQVVSRTSKI
nr:restriction endonuclease subunit S [uncultured Porphyromonas sp.]